METLKNYVLDGPLDEQIKTFIEWMGWEDEEDDEDYPVGN